MQKKRTGQKIKNVSIPKALLNTRYIMVMALGAIGTEMNTIRPLFSKSSWSSRENRHVN